MAAQDWIASLDRFLEIYGQDVTLQRVGTDGITQSVDCRAQVRGYRPQELGGGVIQGDGLALLSPTDIGKMQWQGIPFGDPLVPRKGDKLLVAGRQRNVEAAAPIYHAGTLVRVELLLRG